MNVIVFGGTSHQLANALRATSFRLSDNLLTWFQLVDAVCKYQDANPSNRVPDDVVQKASLVSPAGRGVRLVSDSEQVYVTSGVAADLRPSNTCAMIAFEFCEQRIYVCKGVLDTWFVAAYLNWSDHDRLSAALYHLRASFTSAPARLPPSALFDMNAEIARSSV